MLKVGDKLPAGSLSEFVEVEGNGCSIGPNSFDIQKAAAGKTIAIFGLPGAFTPTCSAKHVPGYVAKAADLKALLSDKDQSQFTVDLFRVPINGSRSHEVRTRASRTSSGRAISMTRSTMRRINAPASVSSLMRVAWWSVRPPSSVNISAWPRIPVSGVRSS